MPSIQHIPNNVQGNGYTGNCHFPEGAHSLAGKHIYKFFFFVVIIAIINILTQVIVMCRKRAISMENFRKVSW